MRSLQRRVVLGGALWALLATIIGAVAVSAVFDQIADRRFNRGLEERHTQAVVSLASSQDPVALETVLSDPAYQRTYSGRYWQIGGEDGSVFTSASLFDVAIDPIVLGSASPQIWDGYGPNGGIRGLSQKIILDNGSQWVVTVAESLSALNAERREMRRSVIATFGFVGALGIAGAVALTTLLVAPLRRLGHDVSRRWEIPDTLDPENYPTEVAPLVSDLNELIRRNRNVTEQGRRQAADLAHALKTPSAALRNEIEAFPEATKHTANMIESLDRIDAQISRSLARMRASNVSQSVNLRTDLANSIARLERLFRSLSQQDDKTLEIALVPNVFVSSDPQDVEEMVGNLLENAMKWSKSRLRLSVAAQGQTANIVVEDDGPGVSAEFRNRVLQEGSRLDTSVPGTGLGLSIAKDLAEAYGGRVELGASYDLGGLAVTLSLPTEDAMLKRI